MVESKINPFVDKEASDQLEVSLSRRRVSLFASVPAFSQLPFNLLRQMEKNLKEQDFRADDLVVSEGEKGDRLYLILEGRAEVSIQTPTGSSVVAHLEEGEIFGEVALLTPAHKRTATVTAVTALRTLTLEDRVFQTLLKDYPQSRGVLEKVAQQLIALNFLKLASPFSGLESTRLERLASRLKKTQFDAGEVIFREGEEADSCFMVRSGKVEVFRKEENTERQVTILEAGSLFGESALLSGSPRNATIRALETTELFSLARADLMDVLQADAQVAAGLFELLSLRDRPQQASGITCHQSASQDGTPLLILRDEKRGTYYRLSQHGHFLWEQLDGRNNLKDITLKFFKTHGVFAPHLVAETVAGLVAGGFAGSRAASAVRTFALTRRSGVVFLLDRCRRVFEWRFIWRGVDPFVSRLYEGGIRILLSWPVQFLFAIGAAYGLGLFLRSGKEIQAALHFLIESPVPFFFLIPAFLLGILFHESGHAFATKAFGRKVLSAGFGWYWLGPIFYVDTSDMWLESKRRRIVVNLAGVYADLVSAGIASILAAFLPDPVSKIVLLYTLLFYGSVVVNLIPLMEYDGYYALSDFLDEPNLRAKVLRWILRRPKTPGIP